MSRNLNYKEIAESSRVGKSYFIDKELYPSEILPRF